MDRGMTSALVAEAIGCFLFFFVGAGAALVTGADLVSVALAHGIVLAVLVSSLGSVSGGHFNPAVTIGLWVLGKVEAMRVVLYVVAQLIGAALAGFVLVYVMNDVKGSVPTLAGNVDSLKGIVIEAVLTAILVFAVIGTAVDRRGPKIGGLAIGLAIGCDILMGGPLTGAAMNPARWFGPAVAAGFYDNFYVWIVGPVVGAVVAGLIYRTLFWTEES